MNSEDAFVLNSRVDLSEVLTSFIYSSAHKSPKTIKTLQETLTPFIVYLHRYGVGDSGLPAPNHTGIGRWTGICSSELAAANAP